MQHHLFEITCTELPEQSLRNEDSRLQEALLRKVAQPLPMYKAQRRGHSFLSGEASG